MIAAGTTVNARVIDRFSRAFASHPLQVNYP
jgi:hypothetical protein